MEVLLLLSLGAILLVAVSSEAPVLGPAQLIPIKDDVSHLTLTGFEGDYMADLSELPEEERANVDHILQTTGLGGASHAATDIKDLNELSDLLRSEKHYIAAHRVDMRLNALASFYHLPA